MNTPGVARFVYGIRNIKPDGAGNRIPPDTHAHALLQLQPVPVVEGVTHVEKRCYRPVFPEQHFQLGTGRDDIVRTDTVVAELLETVTANALAAAGLEAVEVGQARHRQVERLVADLNEAFALLAREELPDSFVCISGPSKTADIEAHMVHGAHGPREVHLVLLSEPELQIPETD